MKQLSSSINTSGFRPRLLHESSPPGRRRNVMAVTPQVRLFTSATIPDAYFLAVDERCQATA